MKTGVYILLLLTGAGVSFAAEAPAVKQSPLPSGPLLKKAGDFCSWRITFSYAQDKTKPADGKPVEYDSTSNSFLLPALPRTVTLTRTKPFWLAVTVDVKGNKAEQCSDGVNEYIDSSNMPSPILSPKDVMGQKVNFIIDYGTVDFPDMNWISAETYTGMQTLDSGPCMVFVKENMTAWIDLETRMPVLWQREQETRQFKELPAPTKALTLPDGIAKLAQALKQDRERLTRKAPRGG